MTHEALIRTIRRRMRERSITPYRLHILLKGQVSKQTVYNFIEHGKGVNTEMLVAVMNVLDLRIGEVGG